MRWHIQHSTRYAYAAPVQDSFNEARLQPFSDARQTVKSFALDITPTASARLQHDYYSNNVHHFEIPEPHDTLLIESSLAVETHSHDWLRTDARPAAMSRLNEALQGERAYDFIQPSRYVDVSPETWQHAIDATDGEDDIWQTALRLMRFVHGHVKYESGSTKVHTHMSEVLREQRGVCQDFAHVMIGLCRTLKIPALYVSGYLATEAASATHAWMEVYVPGFGWQALDPTHNSQPDETYVKIAVGRDYADARPVSGYYRGGTERQMTVSVLVRPD